MSAKWLQTLVIVAWLVATSGLYAGKPLSPPSRPSRSAEAVSPAVKTKYANAELSVPARCTVGNCPLQIKVTSREKPLVIHSSAGVPDSTIVLRDAAGNECPKTQYGKDYLNQNDFVSHVGERIPVGDSHAWTLRLDKYFKLSPGEYIIDVALRTNVLKPEAPDGPDHVIQPLSLRFTVGK